jgi:ppGpp synthetase/RelA/SpoT-type nucleotidyltranferase
VNSEFEKSIFDLAHIVKEADTKKIRLIFSGFKEVSFKKETLNSLKKNLKKTNPDIFSDKIICGDGTVINAKEQEIKWLEFFRGKNLGKGYLLENIKKDLKNEQGAIKKLVERIRIFFPFENYEHSFRIKDFESLLSDKVNRGNWEPIDIVGLRIVPRKSSMFFDAISRFEKEFGNEIIFKLNTFPYDKEEVEKYIGKNSSVYYRAIHYYFPMGCFLAEVQIRTSAIDEWSKLHHDTVYKPKIPVSPQLKKNIMEFGKMADMVDYFEIAKH